MWLPSRRPRPVERRLLVTPWAVTGRLWWQRGRSVELALTQMGYKVEHIDKPLGQHYWTYELQ